MPFGPYTQATSADRSFLRLKLSPGSDAAVGVNMGTGVGVGVGVGVQRGGHRGPPMAVRPTSTKYT